MTWKKLPPWTGKIHHGCATCSHTEQLAPMDMIVAVGFGSASVTRDGECIWEESPGDEEGDYHDVAHFERLAAADPDHDWQITMYGPLRGSTYQRHDEQMWVLVDSNEGFA